MGLITVEGILVPETATELYVCPANTQANHFNLTLTSVDTIDNAARVWIVPSGQSVDDEYKIVGMPNAATALKSGEVRVYRSNQVLDAGDKIYIEADDLDVGGGHVIVAKLDVNEVPVVGAVFDSFTRLYFVNDDNTVYMPDSLSLAWAVPEDPAVQVIQAELWVHNKHTDREPFTMSLVPPGETPGDAEWYISSNTQQWHVAPGESRAYHLEHFASPGYEFHWRALNASRIIARLSFETVKL